MDLEQRVQRLEDIEAIKQLKALYCEICDDNHDPDRIITIFTEDAIWEGKGIARAEGHAEIHALFSRFAKMMDFTQHMTMNPRIEVQGDTATGTWYFFGPFRFRAAQDAASPDQAQSEAQAKWQASRYHETYRREAGGWKIAHLQIRRPSMSVDYQTGWRDQLFN